MTEETNRNEVLDFLKERRVAILGTTDEKGNSHLTPMYFAVDSDFNFYFVTHSQTKKIINVDRNESATVLVYDEKMFKLVEARGITITVNDAEKFKTILRLLPKIDFQMLKFQWPPPIDKFQKGEIVAIHLHPQELYFGDFSASQTGVDGDFFEKII